MQWFTTNSTQHTPRIIQQPRFCTLTTETVAKLPRSNVNVNVNHGCKQKMADDFFGYNPIDDSNHKRPWWWLYDFIRRDGSEISAYLQVVSNITSTDTLVNMWLPSSAQAHGTMRVTLNRQRKKFDTVVGSIPWLTVHSLICPLCLYQTQSLSCYCPQFETFPQNHRNNLIRILISSQRTPGKCCQSS